MNRRARGLILRSVSALFILSSLSACCGPRGQHGLILDPLTGDGIHYYLRDGATQPLVRYANSALGEKADIAVGRECHNAGETEISFGFHLRAYDTALLRLSSGHVAVQGEFPPVTLQRPIPWPIIVTSWISIGAEGTTFAAYTGTDLSGQRCEYVFLYSGGPLLVRVLGVAPPTVPAPPGTTTYRRMLPQSGTVLFIKAVRNYAGQVELSEPKPLVQGDTATKAAERCVAELMDDSKMDQRMPIIPTR